MIDGSLEGSPMRLLLPEFCTSEQRPPTTPKLLQKNRFKKFKNTESVDFRGNLGFILVGTLLVVKYLQTL